MDDNTCPNCKQTAAIGVEVTHLGTCPHKTGDHSKIKEYGHICSECSVYLPGSISRQLCDNNPRMSPAWRTEQKINETKIDIRDLTKATKALTEVMKDLLYRITHI